MNVQSVAALLTDAAGMFLLVRRKNSPLWTLPGGVTREAENHGESLSVYCRRQVGATPDFVAPLVPIALNGEGIGLGFDEIPHDYARACGRVEIVSWFDPAQLPTAIAPVAHLAISIFRRIDSARANVTADLR